MPSKLFIPVEKLTKLQLIELDACVRCAHCAEYCPAFAELNNPDTIPGGRTLLLSKLVKKQKGLLRLITGPKEVDPKTFERIRDSLYECTLCGRCAEVCVSSIQLHSLWETFRSIAHDSGCKPKPLALLEETIREKKNPYGADQELRFLWAERLSFRVPIDQRARTVYFVGCTSSLKFLTQSIAQSMAIILNKVGEDWTLLSNELCCGSPSLMIGDEVTAMKLAIHNVELIESLGARDVVTGCPSCYRALKFKYRRLIGKGPAFEVLHSTELIHRYLRERRLVVEEELAARVAYHDPCELARLGGVIEKPREILKEMVSEFLELPENKFDGRCCGGGGIMQAVDDELRMKIVSKRVRQAEEVKADILISACPACKLTLTDGMKASKSRIEVLDVAEFVAKLISEGKV